MQVCEIKNQHFAPSILCIYVLMHNKTFYIVLLTALSHENINKHNINSTFTERSSIPSNQHITI